MNLAESLHVAYWTCENGTAKTALLFAIRPEWSLETVSTYLAAMSRDDLEMAFMTLCGAVARAGGGEVPSPRYGGPDDFEQAQASALARV